MQTFVDFVQYSSQRKVIMSSDGGSLKCKSICGWNIFLLSQYGRYMLVGRRRLVARRQTYCNAIVSHTLYILVYSMIFIFLRGVSSFRKRQTRHRHHERGEYGPGEIAISQFVPLTWFFPFQAFSGTSSPRAHPVWYMDTYCPAVYNYSLSLIVNCCPGKSWRKTRSAKPSLAPVTGREMDRGYTSIITRASKTICFTNVIRFTALSASFEKTHPSFAKFFVFFLPHKRRNCNKISNQKTRNEISGPCCIRQHKYKANFSLNKKLLVISYNTEHLWELKRVVFVEVGQRDEYQPVVMSIWCDAGDSAARWRYCIAHPPLISTCTCSLGHRFEALFHWYHYGRDIALHHIFSFFLLIFLGVTNSTP